MGHMNNSSVRLILADIRSTLNVGAILRTADATGVELVYACGYTPYPHIDRDKRPAHVSDANHRAIAKTALGAEETVPVRHLPHTVTALREARADGFKIIVVELAERSLNLYQYRVSEPVALVLGNEVTGVDQEILDSADTILELPMIGQKESLNVSVTAGIVLYQLRFGSPN
jgi:23S rRNA (guanosine2251-2'-O)-methyltransferase